MKFTSLATRIEEAHDALLSTPMDIYLLYWMGHWLITSNPQHNARHVGRFTDKCDPRHFAESVYATLEELRPG